MNNFEEIENYLEGLMSIEDRAVFEQRLKTDNQLKKDFDDWNQTADILQRRLANKDREEQLSQILTPLTKNYFKENKSRGKIISIKTILIGVTSVAAALILYFSLPTGIDNFETPEMPQALVRGNETLSNNAAKLFNEHKYIEALPLIQQQAIEKPDDATINYFYAVCLIKNKQYENAVLVLDKLTKGVSVYKSDAAFFAAYAAYKSGKNEAAINYAKQVPPESLYYKKAQKILGRLS